MARLSGDVNAPKPAPAPKPLPKAPKAPPPTIFWLDGTAYHSLAAYQAAVAAKVAATQARAELARKASSKLASVTTVGKPAVPVATSVSPDALARSALEHASAVRRQQELVRLEAQHKLEMQRAAAVRAQQIRELISAGKRTQAERVAAQGLAHERELQRKAAEARMAERRRQAYDALQAESRHQMLLVQAHQRNDGRAIAQLERNRAAELARQGVQVESARGGFQESAGRNNTVNSDMAKRQAQTKGETTGDWSDAISILDRESVATGGRYVDENLMKVVSERYVAPVIDIGNQYEEQMRQAQDLFVKNDMAALRKLIDSSEFQQLEAQFAQYFGDGRTPGSFAPHAQVLTEIAARRERLWTAMMVDPNASAASDAEVQALIDKATAESRVKYQGGGHQEGTDFTGRRDLMFTDQVLDPATGQMKPVVKRGLDAWLARAAAKQRDAEEQQRHDYARQRDIYRRKLHGPEVAAGAAPDFKASLLAIGDAGPGARPEVSARQAAFEKDLASVVPDFKARLLAIKDASPGAREELVRSMLRDAEQGYDKVHGAPGSPALFPVSGRMTGTAGATDQLRSWQADKAAQDAKIRFLSELKQALPGADGSGYGFGDRLNQSFGFGDLLRWAQLPLSGLMAGVRKNRAEGRIGIGPLQSGSFFKPDFNRPSVNLNFHLWDSGSPQDKLLGGAPLSLSVGTTVDEHGQEAYQQYIRDMQSPDSNVRDNAQRAYGSGVIDGNLGWLIEGMADPLNALTPFAWLNRARLAVAVGGGLRELNSLGGIERALLAYAKYSTPKVLGGLGRSALRTDLAKMALGREVGISSTEVLRLSDDEIRSLAEKAAISAEELRASSAFQKLTQRAGIDKEQLLNIVQEKLPGIAREFGLNSVNPFEMTARINAARQGFARAEQIAKEAEQLAARRVAREEGRAALEALRTEAGVQVAKREALDAAKLARHEKLLSGYLGASQDYLKAAARANRAADQLEAIGRMAVPDHARLQAVHVQLREALAESERYADTFTTNADTGLREVARGGEGVVARRYRALTEFTDRFPGGDPAAPRFADLSWRQIQDDRVLLNSRIKGLARALRKAKTQDDIDALKSRLVQAQKAKAGLDFEQAVLDARGAVRRDAIAARERIKPAVRPQRLGAKATNEIERKAESSREVSTRLARQDPAEVRGAPAVSAGNQAVAQATHEALHAKTGEDVADALRSVMAAKPGVKIAKIPAREVLDQLEELASKLGRPLSDIPLEDLAFALQRVAALDGAWGGAAAFVRRLAERVLRESGWDGGWEKYAEMFAGEHIRAGAVGTIAKLEAVDAAVAKRIRQVRGYKAEDVVRAGEKRQIDPLELQDMMRPDRAPEVVLAKMEVLSEHGMTLFEYDELRGALRDVMRKQRREVAMLAEAEKLAAAKGMSVDDAFLQVRERWAERQAMSQYEEFALRPENAGRVPSQVLRLFEERYIGRDLGQMAGTSYSTYQMDSLKAAWKEVTGHEFENQAMRQRWLSGLATIDPEFARLVASDELGQFGRDFKDALVMQVHDEQSFLDVIDGADGVVEARRMREEANRIIESFPDQEMVTEAEMDDLAAAAGEMTAGEQARRRPTTRDSKRNFADTPGGTSGEVRTHGTADVSKKAYYGSSNMSASTYRRWLWNRMQEDVGLRRELMALRGLTFTGGFSVRNDILKSAVDFLWTRKGQSMFKALPDAGMLKTAGVRLARETTDLHAELSRLQELQKVVRQLAGDEFQVEAKSLRASGYLDSLRAELDRRLSIQGYYHSSGDRAAAERALLEMDKLSSDGRAAVWLKDEGWAPVERKGGGWVSVKHLNRWEAAVEGVNVQDAPGRIGIDAAMSNYEPISSILDRQGVRRRWATVNNDDVTGKWGRQAEMIDQRMKAIREELKSKSHLKRDANGNLKGVFVWFDGNEEGAAARKLAAGIYVVGDIDQETLAHEVMHAMWKLPGNEALVDELARYAGRIGPDSTLLRITNVEGVAGVLGDRQEAISELYALWYTKSTKWGEIYTSLDESGQLAMDMLDSRFAKLEGPIRAQMGFGPHAPPLGNRAAMRDWLVQNGYWAPRTGEAIASGQRVWSIAEERSFFEANWAYTPPWTDEAVLRPLLNDQRALKEAFAQWGFFDDGFEQAVGGLDLKPEELLGSVVWGQNGMSAKRSLEEMRQWAVERYGSLVGSIAEDGTVTLERMPWLMKADSEYLTWMERALSEEGKVARVAEWQGARAGLPHTVESAAFKGGAVSEFGIQIDPRLVKPSEIEKLNKALVRATERRIKRLQASHDLSPGDWLPQERLAFAYDVTQELLLDPVWRGVLRGTPVVGQALHLWSSFWRFLVSFQPAFPIMNLIEAAGLRRLLLGVYENGFRPLSIERDKWLIGDLREIGGSSESLFRLADADGGVWLRVGDKTSAGQYPGRRVRAVRAGRAADDLEGRRGCAAARLCAGGGGQHLSGGGEERHGG